MKIASSVFIMFFTTLVFGQNPYDWINVQYDAGDLSEYPYQTYYKSEDGVQYISEVTENFEQDGSSRFTKMFYSYREDGQIKSLDKIKEDGSVSYLHFKYDKDNKFKYQIRGEVFNAGEYRDTISIDTLYVLYEENRADSLLRDESGNTVYFKSTIDETYTRYDAYGRKVQDSIPGTGQTMAHIISYKYSKKKVVKSVIYPGQDLSIETVYYLDPKGNWVKCLIKSNGRQTNALIRRDITYY